MIKVVIADDEELFRVGISYILSRGKEISILHEATNGRELLDFLAGCDPLPDIIITDIKNIFIRSDMRKELVNIHTKFL